MNDAEYANEWLKETMSINEYTNLATILYKYISPESEYFDKNLENFILRESIYLSSRNDFNDPFDSRVKIKKLSYENNQSYVKDLLARHNLNENSESIHIESIKCQDSRKASLDGSLDLLGIYSMTATIKSAPMWAHYGNNHKGLALMFNIASSDFGGIPVRYQSKRDEVSFGADRIEYEVLIKGREWLYEQEYRVTHPGKAKSQIRIPSESILGVIFGDNCHPDVIQKVISLDDLRIKNGLEPLKLIGIRVDPDNFSFIFYILNKNSMLLSEIPTESFK